MGKDKRYLTIDEQISLLESKGLIIDSKKNAIKYLNEIGYYKLINGYREPFLYNLNGEKRFVDDTSIQNLYDLYTFDHKLRVLFFNFISDCEIVIKNRMSELISRKYGINHKIYLQSSNFKQDGNVQTKFEDLKLSICKEISKQKLKNNCLNWYSKNYKYYPFWVLNTVLSFGTISKIYSRMIQADQYEISSYFNLKSDVFESFLLNLTLFRNVCAHNERFYNFRTRNKIKKRDIEGSLAVCENLGNFFQYITRDSGESKSLEEEIRHARSYAVIQGYRFQNKIQIDFPELPEKYGYVEVPRLIVQPLIENVFKYVVGDLDEEEEVQLRVSYEENEENLLVIVENSGSISDEMLKQIQNRIEQPEEGAEVTALVNINSRLNLFFKQKSSLTVSKSGLGGLKIILYLKL